MNRYLLSSYDASHLDTGRELAKPGDINEQNTWNEGEAHRQERRRQGGKMRTTSGAGGANNKIEYTNSRTTYFLEKVCAPHYQVVHCSS